MTEKKILEVEGLETSYDMIKALKGVSLSALSGKLTCILGPNGAGKSTLLFTLAGILNSDRGKVIFDGEDISNQKTSALICIRTAADYINGGFLDYFFYICSKITSHNLIPYRIIKSFHY